MSLFNNYDPQFVLVTLGSIPFLGFASGTMVAVSRNEDAFTMDVGAQGDVVRVRNRNRTGRAVITLLESSPTNDLLSALAREDELFGSGTRAFMIKRLNGTTIVRGPTAWIAKISDVGYAAENGTREWNIDIAELDIFVGSSLV